MELIFALILLAAFIAFLIWKVVTAKRGSDAATGPGPDIKPKPPVNSQK